MKMYPVKFEIVDDDGDLLCHVESVGLAAATVTIKKEVNVASWMELTELVLRSLERLESE